MERHKEFHISAIYSSMIELKVNIQQHDRTEGNSFELSNIKCRITNLSLDRNQFCLDLQHIKSLWKLSKKNFIIILNITLQEIY